MKFVYNTPTMQDIVTIDRAITAGQPQGHAGVHAQVITGQQLYNCTRSCCYCMSSGFTDLGRGTRADTAGVVGSELFGYGQYERY